MKILFGIPDLTHRELANLEIDGIKALIPDCHTIHYGPVHSKRGLINKIIFTIKNALSIKKALKNNKYDLLFLNTAFNFTAIVRDCITLFILKNQKTKFFLKFHGADIVLLEKLGVYKMLVNWLLNTAHGVGVLSSEEKNAFLLRGFQEQKVFIVKNPVNPALYVKDINFKNTMGLADPTFIFIFCGRFIAFKGLMDVLNALKIVVSEFQYTHLFCIGDGPEMSKAQKFVTHNELNSFVTFTGFISEIETRNFYSNADALVFPSSHPEGFPMVVFQSLAAGIPIITTRIRASADYLKEPDNVLWGEPHNPVQIAESMIKLLTDNALVNRMKSNNVIKAYQFTTEKNALEYMSIFEKLIKE